MSDRNKDREVPSFRDVDAAIKGIKDKESGRPANLYPRDGNFLLANQEARVAKLFGVAASGLLLYPNGVRAVQETVDLAKPGQGTTIVHGNDLYSQNNWYLGRELPDRGVRSFGVNAGSPSDIDRDINNVRPDVIFFETVANGPGMAVLDVGRLLSNPAVVEKNPLIVLDDTLTTTANSPYHARLLAAGQRIAIVASGTKYLGMNEEMAGIVYSGDEELITTLKLRRPRTGSTPADSSIRRLAELLPGDSDEFAHRLLTTTVNSHALARACSEVEGRYFSTIYPNLPTHPNYEYAKENFPKGAAPVFFINPVDHEKVSQVDIARALWSNPTIRELGELGQSFGFDNIRVWPDIRPWGSLRISGGMENQSDQAELIRAFQHTLGSIGERRLLVPGIGEKIVAPGVGRWEIGVVAQQGENDCGQALLKGLGYPADQLPDEPVSTLDLEWTFGGQEVGLPESQARGTPVIALVKKNNGNNHWVSVVANHVINPEGGQVTDAKEYLETEVSEVIAAFHVPFANGVEKNDQQQIKSDG